MKLLTKFNSLCVLIKNIKQKMLGTFMSGLGFKNPFSKKGNDPKILCGL